MNLDAYASGSTEPWTVSVLESLVRIVRPGRLLELGTFEARTTRSLAPLVPHVTTVDIERRFEGGLPKNVWFVQADALEFLRRTPDGAFSFAFVDDDHGLEHVRAEVAELRRVVIPGGFIVLHDVIGPFGLEEVVRENDGWIVELPLLHAAGGLGIIRV